MSAIGSPLRSNGLAIGWGLFTLANLWVMTISPGWETVPFHLVWVSLTLVYGLQVWGVRTTALVLLFIIVVTGAIIIRNTFVLHEHEADEIVEVPLMAAMFVAMVWHARRHKAATALVEQMADHEHHLRALEREFVRNASHELRTPITVARGHAELARLAQTDAQASEDLDIVLTELDRLSALSSSLLSLAAADGTYILHRRPIDVGGLVTHVGRRWSTAVSRTWKVEPPASTLIEADPDRLEAALDALVENAVEFTTESDTIAIRAEAAGDTVTLIVADTGSGIDPDLRSRIFEPFARADFGLDHRSGGTGLGLAIVKTIVEAHGGTVNVSSALGVGSTFEIHLPVASARLARSGQSLEPNEIRAHDGERGGADVRVPATQDLVSELSAKGRITGGAGWGT